MTFKKIIKKEKKVLGLIIIISLIVVLSTIFVSAFAVGSPGKVSLYPGESSEDSFSIQNIIEPSENITVEVSIEDGGDYISFLEGTTFDVAAGEVVPVKISISVPSDAKVGDVYKIKVAFRPTLIESRDEGGTVQFSSSYVVSFNVEVAQRPEETPEEGISLTWWILGILAVIIIIVIVSFILKGKKGQTSTPVKEDKREEPSE